MREDSLDNFNDAKINLPKTALLRKSPKLSTFKTIDGFGITFHPLTPNIQNQIDEDDETYLSPVSGRKQSNNFRSSVIISDLSMKSHKIFDQKD